MINKKNGGRRGINPKVTLKVSPLQGLRVSVPRDDNKGSSNLVKTA